LNQNKSASNTCISAKRARCAKCTRPQRNCICALIQSTENLVKVLILQHPEEAPNAKNTAGLLHLSLKNSQLQIGEAFSQDNLQHWLYSEQKQPVLLYPDTPEHKTLGLAAPAPVASIYDTPTHQLLLVVIDATWRKSRKMLYLNPALQSLPRMTLTAPPASLYTIRKAHSKIQLSTLEASCYALQQLEQQHIDYAPLLTAMGSFVAQQSAFVPPLNEQLNK
jgi:DTW domain-containing protein YfiP